jgi:serine/threonine protein kinase
MNLSPGTRLGPYEILSPLGAGGMGEVYRARDTRLEREVAVKVLPQHLSANPEVRARFEREARTVSSLNHPSICTLHDVGREGDTDYLVMELIDGETLADRIARGALPIDQVLAIGAQVADALDRAHRAGVVHRDLKPGNIMLTRSGAKLMDFGLARATGLAGPGSGSGVTVAALTQSPTVAHPLTAEGTIVGTFQYMSPEQLEGKEADARSDIWALGCVLYEMVTGTRAFEGNSQASLIGAIMHAEPRPLVDLQPASPGSLDRLIRECLSKDPDERWQNAGDLRRELRRIALQPVGDVADLVLPGGRSRGRLIAIVGVVALAGALAGFSAGHHQRGTKVVADQIAFTISPPSGTRFRFTIEEDGVQLAPPVVSPQGRNVVFGVVDTDGARRLLIRDMNTIETRPLPGSDDARCPFWSLDGQSVGFFAGRRLQKLALNGAAPVVLAGNANNPRGASWGSRGTILYAPSANSGLFEIPEAGGTPVQVTFPDTTIPDVSHRWPLFLPDGEHFVFLVWTNSAVMRDSVGGIYVGSTRNRETRRISTAPSSAWLAAGDLVFARDRTIMRAPFDLKSLTLGPAVATGERIDWDPSTGLACFSISETGTLMLRESNPVSNTRLVWFDRTGAPLDSIGERMSYQKFAVARDAPRGVMTVNDASTGSNDIWVMDFTRGLSTRFTRNPADETDPAVSSDGRRLGYTSDVGGPYHVFTGAVDQSTPVERISPPAEDWNLLDWSRDGSLMLLGTASHLWVLDVASRSGKQWHTVSGSQFNRGCFSPDARWISFDSSESGRDEIYVRPYPGPGGQWQVSTDGGFDPHWSNDGREIVYLDTNGNLMAADVQSQGEFRTGKPRRLFRVGPRTPWAITGDHSRILIAVRAGGQSEPPLKVVTNWAQAHKR